MLEYFKIECLSLSRKIKENGYPLFLSIIFYLFIFILASYAVFEKFYFPQYIFLGGIFFVLGMRFNKEKRFFLTYINGEKTSRLISVIENIIVIAPFALVLFFYGYIVEIILAFLIAIFIGLKKSETFFKNAIPTPFFNFPFEFQIGFRKYFIFILLAYLIILFRADEIKYEAELSSFLGLFAIISTFYSSNIEDPTYLIINKRNAHEFLLQKLLTSFLLTNLLVFPMLSILIFKATFSLNELGLFYAQGNLFILFVILAKYSVFPNRISLAEGTVVAVSIILLPIFLITFPRFYFKAYRNLNQFLSNDCTRKSI
ncbi:MAG: hypothetical protein ACXIUD_05730 [Mongoliitalea sp.]